jgi:hypothetical protein
MPPRSHSSTASPPREVALYTNRDGGRITRQKETVVTLSCRLLFALTLIIASVRAVSAQPAVKPDTTATTATTTTTTTAAAVTASSGEAVETSGEEAEAREEFEQILRRQPSRVTTVVLLEPSLLSNDAFLGGYPEVARFVAAHPKMRTDPNFYLTGVSMPRPANANNDQSEAAEALAMIGVMIAIVLGIIWLVRTFVEQKRWNRLVSIQSEVHNKILDRFGSSEEVLQYIKSPAGTKFLEAAPVSVHEEHEERAPRTIRSIGIGIIVCCGSVAAVIGSMMIGAAAKPLLAFGAIAFGIGLGFIVSALVSMALAKRGALSSDAEALENSGLMR